MDLDMDSSNFTQTHGLGTTVTKHKMKHNSTHLSCKSADGTPDSKTGHLQVLPQQIFVYKKFCVKLKEWSHQTLEKSWRVRIDEN